jgi:hypothetical protein
LPDVAGIAQRAKERDYGRSRDNQAAYTNLMQMLGRGYGAYQMNREFKDWKQKQQELQELKKMEEEYEALQDQYGIEAADRLMEQMYANNPYAIPGNVGADQNDYALYQLGLRK